MQQITKKGGDMTEFYFHLSQNVAFGAQDGESTKVNKHKEESKSQSQPSKQPESVQEENIGETSKKESEIMERKPVVGTSQKQEVVKESENQEKSGTEAKPQTDHHKRTQDALAAAKERFLARKKTKY